MEITRVLKALDYLMRVPKWKSQVTCCQLTLSWRSDELNVKHRILMP